MCPRLDPESKSKSQFVVLSIIRKEVSKRKNLSKVYARFQAKFVKKKAVLATVFIGIPKRKISIAWLESKVMNIAHNVVLTFIQFLFR